jgi:hypothetical protein
MEIKNNPKLSFEMVLFMFASIFFSIKTLFIDRLFIKKHVD